MVRLANFSHPISSYVKEDLEKLYDEEVSEFIFKVQLDFDLPLIPQFETILNEYRHSLAENAELYIPPAMSFAASYFAKHLTGDMVVIKRTQEPFTKFVLGEVISFK